MLVHKKEEDEDDEDGREKREREKFQTNYNRKLKFYYDQYYTLKLKPHLIYILLKTKCKFKCKLN